MLTPDELLHITDGAEDIAESLHRDILDRIIERIMTRIGRGDGYILTAQDKWQLQVLQDAGFLMEDIQKEIAKYTGLMQTEVAEAMEDAGVRSLAYDNKIYEAAGLSAAPLDQSPALIRIAQRNYEATMGTWANFTQSMAHAGGLAYQMSCDKAYNLVMSGTVSYAQAVKEALSEIVKEGVTVQYYDPAGNLTRRDTIETATMRAVRTGISQATAQSTDARMEEMEWDIILVSSHLGARVTGKGDFTDHASWQGKFYSKSGKDKRFPPYSVCGQGNVQGIHGANCRHTHGPGDGEHNPWKDYDSEENRKAYERQQRQRTLENRIRNSKREVATLQTARDNATDDAVRAELDREYQRKAAVLQRQNAEYNQFCKDNNLRKRSDRISIAKWDRSEAAKARAAAKKYAEDHPDSVKPKEYKPKPKKEPDAPKRVEEAPVIPQERTRRRREGYFERQRARQQPKFEEMSRDDLDKYVSENISATFDNMSGANLDFYRKAVKSVDTVENVYGKIDGLKVSFGGIKGNAYAEYDPRTKTLFLKKKGSLSQFAESIAKADERTLRKYGIKYNAESSYEGTVLHELGHAVDHDGKWGLSKSLGATDDILIKARSISFYARDRGMPNLPRATEATAENLSAYFLGHKEKIDADVLDIIEQYIKRNKND